MTPAELDAVLLADDIDACVTLFEHATEAERKAVAKRATTRLRSLTTHGPARDWMWYSRFGVTSTYHVPQGSAAALLTAQVAVLASASLGELKKLAARALPDEDLAVSVLSSRRPPWLSDWVAMVCSLGPDYWPMARRLVRTGLCKAPDDDQYIHGMIAAIPVSGFHSRRTLRETLLADPGLLENEIWRIFEVEPRRGELSHLTPTEPGSRFQGWDSALKQLADEGVIPRVRLLDASLCGLERDLHELRARWFAHVYESLAPTESERSKHTGRYLGLLGSRNASTVVFALKALTALDRHGSLDANAVVDSIGPALLARAKGTVNTALALLDHAAGKDPNLKQRAAIAAADALVHEAVDAQKQALALIERHGNPSDPALTDVLQDRANAVAPSLRPRLDAWLGSSDRSESADTSDDDGKDLLERAGRLDPNLARLAGVPEALAAVHAGGGDLAAIEMDCLEQPRLDPATTVVPVADVDQLIELYSVVLENPGTPEDLERVLDGVSRLCDQRPDDLDHRVAPLFSRITQFVDQTGRLQMMVSAMVPPLWDLAHAWIKRRAEKIQFDDQWGTLIGFHARRVRAIAKRVAEGRAAPLLSLPTHAGGWIDPRVLVERLEARRRDAIEADRWDGSLALLRLAPEDRADALERVRAFDGEFASALRYALGAENEPIGGPTAPLWIAAARTRQPELDDPNVELRYPKLGPDAGRAGTCSLRGGFLKARTWLDANQPLILHDPPLPPTCQHDLPTVFLHDSKQQADAALTRWAATIWPPNLEAFFAIGIDASAGMDGGLLASHWNPPYLEPLLNPDRPMRSMARLLLATSLSAKRPESYGLAVDALIQAIDDGRIAGDELGAVFASLLTGELVKPTRLAKTLGDVARVSPLHARAVARSVERSLENDYAKMAKDIHTLLGLLKELLIQDGEPLTLAPTRAALEGWKVSGKAGALVKDLLVLPAKPNAARRLAAATRALKGRVERAERWSRWLAAEDHEHN